MNVVSAGSDGCQLTGMPTGKTGETEDSAVDHLNVLELDVFLSNICPAISQVRTLAVKNDERPQLLESGKSPCRLTGHSNPISNV